MKKSLYIALVLVFISAVWYGCKDQIELPGELHGVVTDKATGEPIKTAGVELQSIGLKTVTGTDGQYGFNEIDPGKYKLYITKTGYADWLSNEIVVKSEQIAQGDVQLEKLPPALKILDGAGKELDTLDFGAAEADEARSFNIFNDGSEGLQWQISKTAKWIKSFSVESGKLEAGGTQAVVVTIDRNQLDEKQNATTIQITSNNGSKELLVLAMNNRETMVVNVAAASDITASTAVFHGKIINGGNPPVTERGFVYTTESVATLENTIEKLTVAVNEQKEYSIQVRNLELGKTYNVRAYASNILGVVYSSNSVSVIPEATLPVVETDDITSIDVVKGTAVFSGNILNDGDPIFSEKGFAYGIIPNPTIDDERKIVSGSGTGKYSANIIGLEDGETYHIRAYATNAKGTAYGDDITLDFFSKMPDIHTNDVSNINRSNGTATFNATLNVMGDFPCIERGFVYSTIRNPTIESGITVVAVGNGEGDYMVNVTNLSIGEMYYIRAYVTTTKGTTYGSEVMLDFNPILPIVKTKKVEVISNYCATFHASIETMGEPNYIEAGFVYGTIPSPTIGAEYVNKMIVNGTGIGNYDGTETSLKNGTKYYVRAYLKNEYYTVYGETQSFIAADPVYVIIPGTKLMVQKKNLGGTCPWESADAVCKGSTLAGYTDWRLPTKEELMVIFNNRMLVENLVVSYTGAYWASTSCDFVNMDTGAVSRNCNIWGYVRAVRTVTEENE